MADRRDFQRQRLEVAGLVQGIGFRPFVFGLAQRCQLTGHVFNHSSGVTIEVEGAPDALAVFRQQLTAAAPQLARIDSVETADVDPQGSAEFRIIASAGRKQVSTPISADVSICGECLREMSDPADRRFRYPFINCTNCGPRFTIIRDIPYDRSQTTMAEFVMCPQCQAEYDDPSNRRFHAQPNACAQCGPQLWFAITAQAADQVSPTAADQPMDSEAALQACRAAIRQGSIVAVRGLGGFHLVCDAAQDDALVRLRDRKGRSGKPFAVMVPDLSAARQLVQIDDQEAAVLTSRQRPIVLLQRRDSGDLLSTEVAPGNNCLGIMLPYSPLHQLLLEGFSALVMTSGNLSEEPIVCSNAAAVQRLAGIADAFVFHNREIHVPCDDSVVRIHRGQELPVRRSRGYAPLPVRLAQSGLSVLAVGGELKATFCVTKNDYAYLSQHIGDLANLETLQELQDSVAHFCRLFRVQPEAIACDLHPGYLGTRWAETYAQQAGIPLIPVQHHHAHIAALKAEHQSSDRVLGICFDGTGYGTESAIWGGEFLSVDDRSSVRVAGLQYMPLPGGDTAVKRPYRIALAALWAAEIPWQSDLPCVQACPESERSVLRTQLDRNLNCVPTSSMGRLFDAVASLIGIRQRISYEAQAAMELEACADNGEESVYAFDCDDGQPQQINSAAVLQAVITDLRRGVSRSVIAGRFHSAVAALVTRLSCQFRDRTGVNTVGLSGGVFQNVLLLSQTESLLTQNGFQVLIHHQVPCNDGGLALGQAAVAREVLESRGGH